MGPFHLFRFSLAQASLRAGEVAVFCVRQPFARSSLGQPYARRKRVILSTDMAKIGAMKDTKFFEQALELVAPWKVVDVNMDLAAKKVEVKVDCGSAEMWLDPQSGQRLHIHGYEQRRWRHLPTMQFETIIVAQVPRLKYPDGHTEFVKVPWADKHSQWTMLFERLAVEVLQACRSLSQACNLLDLDWRSAHRMMQRAVQRGLDARELEGLRRVGLDEKSFGLGQRYVSVLSDLEQSRVLEVVPGNDTQSGCALWQSLPQAQREKIEAAAMDIGHFII